MNWIYKILGIAILMTGKAIAGPVIDVVAFPDRTFPPAAVLVDINISNLRSGTENIILGAFDFGLRFNSNIFDKNRIFIFWGDGLGNVSDGEAIVIDSITDINSTISSFNFEEVSLLATDQLRALQGGGFRLATLGFFAPNPVLQNTQTFFSIPTSAIVLSDANGIQIDYTGSSRFATIDLRVVPEPATLALILMGLLCVGLTNWRSRKIIIRDRTDA
jgi:hypothetical protein